MTPCQRYIVIQIPGWVLAAVIVWGLHHWTGLPRWWAVVLFLAYVAKDFLLYPLLRSAYEEDGRAGAEPLIGRKAIVVETLNPEGYVRVRGELWRAEAAGGTVPAGANVRIVSAHGMTLAVEVERKA